MNIITHALKSVSCKTNIIPTIHFYNFCFLLLDCKDVCENGWCEETMKSYKCHYLTGFRGRHCDEREANEEKKSLQNYI